MMPSTVQTWGFLDGAGLLDIQPRGWNWRHELETLQSLMSSMLGFTQPVFPAYCAQLFPGELYKCLIGQYRMPLITSVPYFVNVPQARPAPRLGASCPVPTRVLTRSLARSSFFSTTCSI